MNKISIASAVILTAVLIVLGFKTSARRWDLETQSARAETENQQLVSVHLSEEHRRLEEEHGSIKQQVSTAEEFLRSLKGSTLNSLSMRTNIPPAGAEQLLSDLGYNWNTTGDYLVVSKSSLAAFSFPAIHHTTVIPGISEMLAITPDENAAIQQITEGIAGEYAAWAKEHIQRHEPRGKVLAKYALAFDPGFSQSLSNRLSQGLLAILGPERSALFIGHSSGFMSAVGIGFSKEANFELTLKSEELWIEQQSSGGGKRVCLIKEYSDFPGEFRAVFPGGWAELAEREHFELPKSFSTK